MTYIQTLLRKYSATSLTLLLFFLTGSIHSTLAASASDTNKTFLNVNYIKNFDGDSITFDIPDTPSIVGKNIIVRLLGIDTPELHKHSCQAEKEKAVKAQELVQSLLQHASVINLHQIGRGKYFRILADVEFDGKDLATILMNNDLAVAYSGGKKEHDWCSTKTRRPDNNSYNSTLPPKVKGIYVWPPPPSQKK